MNNEKLNCCDTDQSNCDTNDSNCCTTDLKAARSSNNKKYTGLAVLLLGVVFAIASAFSTGDSSETASCGTGQEGCATSCEPASTGTSCCSIK